MSYMKPQITPPSPLKVAIQNGGSQRQVNLAAFGSPCGKPARNTRHLTWPGGEGGRLKAARTLADTEPAKPPRSGRPVAQAPPVHAPPPSQRGRPRQVTFSLPPTSPPITSSTSASSRRFATPGRQPDSTSKPAAAEFGGDLWWRVLCSR